jgi:hypothetical protein
LVRRIFETALGRKRKIDNGHQPTFPVNTVWLDLGKLNLGKLRASGAPQPLRASPFALTASPLANPQIFV